MRNKILSQGLFIVTDLL